mmetsp:Transcript_19035/g.34414  ORF Transcript_19035/g.34414 Transcript_19035/m.34414 type:complete len:299 (+) Transcript_19035:58-954(+)
MGDSNALQQVLLAGTSNACAGICTNPVDVVKVHMQMQGEGSRARSPVRGFLGVGREIWQRHGGEGLLRGVQASVLRELSYSGIRLGLYEPVKQALGAKDPKTTPLWLKITAGALTGAGGSLIANPLDLVKVRMQAPPKEGLPTYGSALSALVAIGKEGGWIGLYRGAGPTVKRAALLTGSQVPSYDHAKHYLLNHGIMTEGHRCHFVCSMFAGVVAALVTSPIDLVKSRMMVQPVDATTQQGLLYSSTGDCLMKVARAEGPLGLYKGFHAQWLRIGPHTTISLMVFEYMRHLVGMAYL